MHVKKNSINIRANHNNILLFFFKWIAQLLKKRFIFEQKCKTTTSSSNILRQSLKGVNSILNNKYCSDPTTTIFNIYNFVEWIWIIFFSDDCSFIGMGCDYYQFGNICMHDRCPLSLFPIINYHVKKIIFRNEYIFIPSCDHRGRNLNS